MPSATNTDDDDPVIASYDVIITKQPTKTPTSSSKLLVLQYPSHRPQSKPYNAARSQKPTRLRMKPNTGLVEVEIPILTQENYNPHAGEKFGQSLVDGQQAKKGGSYGLGGGFSFAPASAHGVNISDVPAHDDRRPLLKTQTLGGKIAPVTERDPLYMLGVFKNDEVHLTHLDAVVQMRPQLHHIDAEDELEKRKTQAAAGGKAKQGFEPGPPKLETKAIELKLKKAEEDPATRGLNDNVKLLRRIQEEEWASHDWIDQAEEESSTKFTHHLILQSPENANTLQSIITNDEWLDKMSAPRDDGKKGLRSKLKGRDRERARRKKVEYQKRHQHTTSDGMPGASGVLISDSDASSSDEQSDVEMIDQQTAKEEVNIKQEPASVTADLTGASQVSDSVAEPSVMAAPAKKRGRPKKAGTHEIDG